MKNDFSKAEFEQELYNIEDDKKMRFIKIKSCGLMVLEDKHGAFFSLNTDGTNENGRQIIYWHKPEIKFQPDPVKMVKKEHIHYINIYKNNCTMYTTHSKCVGMATTGVIEVGRKITIPYEDKE